MKVSEAVDPWLRSKAPAAPTARKYRETLVAVAADLGDPQISAVTTDDLEPVLLARWGSAAPATWNLRRAACGSLWTWALSRGHAETNPVMAIERRRPVRTELGERQAAPMAEVKVDELLRTAPAREAALWAFLYDTACRAEEALPLNVEDLDLDDRSAWVVGKGGEHRRVFWRSRTSRYLERYLREVGRRSGPVWTTSGAHGYRTARRGDQAPDGTKRLSYRTAAERAAARGLNLHRLRHSQATHLAERNVDITVIRAKTGHTSLRSVERYARPGPAAARAATDATDV